MSSRSVKATVAPTGGNSSSARIGCWIMVAEGSALNGGLAQDVGPAGSLGGAVRLAAIDASGDHKGERHRSEQN